MKDLTTLSQVEAELLSYAPNRLYGADYKLERVTKLLAHIGNPQQNLRVIHVAGTSGKTSTAYYVRGLLETTGATVGLTVSPHIKTTCERIQIGGAPVSEEKFVQYFNEFYPLVIGFDPRPTYFELMTAFAYWVFDKEKVDYAVVEVGLGGRYDATNTVTRQDKVCIINSIGYDHTEILGETLAEIAGEKAGIIQERNVVFTVPQEEEAAQVIAAEVAKKDATLTTIQPTVDHSLSVPAFQQHNFQLALAAVRYTASRDGLTLPRDVSEVAQSVVVPGRFEVYTIGEKTVVLDGAHNPQKLEAVLGELKERAMQPAVVVAALSEAPDRKVAECVRLLSEYSDRSIYTTFTVQRDVLRRSVGFEQFSHYVRPEDSLVEAPAEAFKRALQGDEPYIVVTGSLYLVSVLRPFVQQQAGL
jgi:dihydrofolate synthase/folylpolyglutamate synthase